ncbi:hypothetical protein IW262DRAFT_1467030 [Armillaria fumosa]|nr:hypothetical protein IW262DRAFT_1467030 [Armillaria fumosa]
MFQRLCGGIRENVTRVWTATSSNATVVAKVYGPLYFRDSYDITDPIRLAASEVSPSIIRKDGLHVTGKDLRYLCEKRGETDETGTDYANSTTDTTVFRLGMDFIQLGVSPSYFAP